MRRRLDILLQDHSRIIGATGTAWTVALVRINTFVGIALGVATTTAYLAIKIRK